MAAVDFITALGRLLHDGKLRDAFAANPAVLVEQLGLCGADRSRFLQLISADLEFQARVLLRKRFDFIGHALPRTCRALGDQAWEEFHSYGRSSVPSAENQRVSDVFGFCMHLCEVRPTAVCSVELNRVKFAHGRSRCCLHLIRAMPVREKRRLGLQLFLRHRAHQWHEWRLYFGV